MINKYPLRCRLFGHRHGYERSHRWGWEIGWEEQCQNIFWWTLRRCTESQEHPAKNQIPPSPHY